MKAPAKKVVPLSSLPLLNLVQGFGVVAVTGIATLTLWGQWTALATLVALPSLTLAVNLWITRVFLPRRARRILRKRGVHETPPPEPSFLRPRKPDPIGRIAAGVAHEVNTPLQYVSDSLHFLRGATDDLMRAVEKLQALQQSHGDPAALAEAEAALEAADLPYLRDHLSAAFDRSLTGLAQVATVVASVTELAHTESEALTLVDLNRAIASTLSRARSECDAIAIVEADLGELPPVRCHAGDVKRAVLDILVTSARAIGEGVRGTEAKGRITVQTRQNGAQVVIRIVDTGPGIPACDRDHLFDPFFGIKPGAERDGGARPGLSVAHAIIVERHGGQLVVESTPEEGNTFLIRLPINGDRRAARRPIARA